ncbi:hypothetical protein [Marivita sp. GX14005]|uniref:hypothetical protein n=1 Tax=Marivita sp. GX14005 TaxID=2942276 RepID=UPI002018D09B|nr:hypothetical protein [Marivita sp. GX14005]MCL3883660.1 hypothetical protein [Marivita sp. GX14005]
MRQAARAAALLALLAGCAVQDAAGTGPASRADTNSLAAQGQTEEKIAAVRDALLAMDASVDREEAARAARIAVQQPLVWARAWRMTDPPLMHNFKVVHGLREKGVCQDFADAMHVALRDEGFRTLEIHRALGNIRTLGLEHATVILSARGQPMEQGIVLDPWRLGQGRLWFGRTTEDPRYEWETPESARAWRLQRRGG